MSDASPSTERARRSRFAWACSAVVLLVLQVGGAWAFALHLRREQALDHPEAAELLRWRPDVTGTVERHGDGAFTISGASGLETIGIDPETILVADHARVGRSTLRPGVTVSVWGRTGARPGLTARVILVWLPSRR